MLNLKSNKRVVKSDRFQKKDIQTLNIERAMFISTLA